jgi:hypothetical protein
MPCAQAARLAEGIVQSDAHKSVQAPVGAPEAISYHYLQRSLHRRRQPQSVCKLQPLPISIQVSPFEAPMQCFHNHTPMQGQRATYNKHNVQQQFGGSFWTKYSLESSSLCKMSGTSEEPSSQDAGPMGETLWRCHPCPVQQAQPYVQTCAARPSCRAHDNHLTLHCRQQSHTLVQLNCSNYTRSVSAAVCERVRPQC